MDWYRNLRHSLIVILTAQPLLDLRSGLDHFVNAQINTE